jgi:hypothetical protein
MEEEVRAAYTFLSKAEKERKTIPVGLLAGQSFKLFCAITLTTSTPIFT